MRFRRKSAGKPAKLQFTALIDMVFLLLVFFMLTLKITAQEGELTIEMPAVAEPKPDDATPLTRSLHVRLVADAEGRLQSLRLGAQSLGGGEAAIEELRREMAAIVARHGADRDPIEIEIDADPQLDYRRTIDAISAVTGRIEKQDGKERLIRYPVKIRFAPPRR